MSSLILSRRRLLVGASSLAALPFLPFSARAAQPRQLAITRRSIEVNGRAADMFGVQQPDGSHGLTLAPDEPFRVDLANACGEPAIIHWHGMTPPFLQDGVADRDRPPIAPGGSASYDFTPRPGTHWMHSHHGLQEQHLMAAPLIVHSAGDLVADEQEVVVLLHDFTFRDPAEILAELTGGQMMDHSGHGAAAMTEMDHGEMDHGAMGHGNMDNDQMNHGAGGMDLNDVEYDAYLANDRTLDDPLVVRTERRGRVRLRLINGATTTAFHIDLGALSGTVVAVDGNDIQPVTGSRFGMSMGQRLDIRIDLPVEGGAFPILAEREGDTARTGIILATPEAAIARLAARGEQAAAPVDLAWEAQFRAARSLPSRSVDQRFELALTGSMSPYVWSIDDRVFGQHRPLRVDLNQRIEIDLVNRSHMAHPMHLHGHHFQVVAINGTAINGAMRDTVLVPIAGRVRIAFDADNPGRWPLHCHNLLHMATGMMTEVEVA
ncbi:MAG: multicopper oxidase family protein [Rhodospirillaceae bacterium]|nr:multicopper oxidase family protein [Rhodospirillaceae bacterium]